MKKHDAVKSEMSRDTLKSFFDQFDLNDPHIRIVLETLFEEIYGIRESETLPVPSEKR